MTKGNSIGVEVKYWLPFHLRHANRKELHKIVMSGFPDGQLDKATPRSDARCLFQVSKEELRVRHRPGLSHQIPGLAAERSDVFPTRPEQLYSLESTVNAQISRSQRGSLPPEVRQEHSPRGHRVPVPQDELRDWALSLLRRQDLEPADLVVGERFNVKRTYGRGGTLPAVDISVKVQGGAALDLILSRGLGRCLSYGLGMVHAQPIRQNTPERKP